MEILGPDGGIKNTPWDTSLIDELSDVLGPHRLDELGSAKVDFDMAFDKLVVNKNEPFVFF